MGRFDGASLTWLSDSEKDRLRNVVTRTLPGCYEFEIEKSLRRLRECRAKRVCLQFPEGLLVWAENVALILEEFGEGIEDVFVLGDVTYGACCVDDIKARSLRCDFLIHYAHSCLVSIDSVDINCLYVFVEIYLNPDNLVNHIVAALPSAIKDKGNSRDGGTGGQRADKKASPKRRRVALLSSVQFVGVVYEVRALLQKRWPDSDVFIPHAAPLTPGETLGCTSPTLDLDVDVAIFVADGRFHLESAMIHNPHVTFYRFDPFLKLLFSETYDIEKMRKNREKAIADARRARTVCVITSTLGRQGSIGIMEYLLAQIRSRGISAYVVLVGEMSPSFLNELAGDSKPEDVGFVQVGCPRLSIDWGHEFGFPLLSPYEAHMAFASNGTLHERYPMDYFASAGGVWSNYGRGTHRDGSLAPSGSQFGSKERLRKLWEKRRKELQAAT